MADSSGESRVSRCAILLGTPITWEEFERAAKPDTVSDYLSGMLRGRTAADAWEEDYEDVAEAAQQLLGCAQSLGAGVYCRATLADFTDATSRYQFVVLLAHWRGVMFRADDLIAGTDVVLDRIRQTPSLRDVVVERDDVEGVVDALNGAVESQLLLSALPTSVARAGHLTSALGSTLCRDLLDEALADLVRPGNRLELFDGLHTPSAVERALAAEFTGELDLALCNSAALATVLDLRRGGDFHHLHWPQYMLPLPQILKIEQTLKEMAANGDSYIRVRLGVEERERGGMTR